MRKKIKADYIIGNKKKDFIEIKKLEKLDIFIFLIIVYGVWKLYLGNLFVGGFFIGYSLCYIIESHLRVGVSIKDESVIGLLLKNWKKILPKSNH